LILFTDGTRTYVTNIYDDAGMTWRPVFNVPHDLQYYPALSGYVIQGNNSSIWQHNASGLWDEEGENQQTVFRMNQVKNIYFVTCQIFKRYKITTYSLSI